jgi:dolichol-phosphate mannosyltransferase
MLLSLVIPVYNEVQNLPLLLAELREAVGRLSCEWEAVFVDDGSTDRSGELLREVAQQDPRVQILGFSRNFGHQAAITAGLDFARGDAVVIMDADLQDPPDLIPRMVELFESGYDVVSAQRATRLGESWFKRRTASVFYWIMRNMVDRRLQPEVGDFRLLSRRAVVAMRGFREEHRFIRGLVAWLGLKEAVLQFDRRPRAAGETKYSLIRMLRFAWTAVSSFSALPLRLCIACGLMLAGSGVLYLAWAIQAVWISKTAVPGWASLVALQCVFSGITLVALGLIGDYVAKIYEESKGRPLYVVDHLVNAVAPGSGVARVAILGQSPAPARHSETTHAVPPGQESGGSR